MTLDDAIARFKEEAKTAPCMCSKERPDCMNAPRMLIAWLEELRDRRRLGVPPEKEYLGKYRAYLGDSVYAIFDGGTIIIYLDNGIKRHSYITLEEDVFQALIKFHDQMEKER